MSRLKVPFFNVPPTIRARVQATVKSTAFQDRFLDTLMPPHSLISGKVLTTSDHGADTLLWQSLWFLDDPCCNACGFPFDFVHLADAQENLCVHCTAYRPKFDHARAAIAYDDTSRKLVLDFKHGGRTDGLAFFARQLRRAGHDILKGADMLVPVPLHRVRLRQRKFNQAALLAGALSKISDIPYETSTLVRHKNTLSQGGQSFLGRRRNVANAFSVQKQYLATIKGKHVVLIDDVYTTGSTLTACTQKLKAAGARRVDALTLMRVVRPQEMPK